jgi:DnaK suppressor protein
VDEPDDLTDAQIDELKADLMRLRHELKDQESASGESAKPVALDQSAVGRLSRMDALQQQSMAVEEKRRRGIRSQQVAASLSAIEEGTYGACRRCEEPIGFRRLKARPESPFCVPCTGRLESR